MKDFGSKAGGSVPLAPTQEHGPNQVSALLTPSEVAAVLKVHPKTAVRLARESILPGFRIGKHWRFRATDLKWVDSQVRLCGQPAERWG